MPGNPGSQEAYALGHRAPPPHTLIQFGGTWQLCSSLQDSVARLSSKCYQRLFPGCVDSFDRPLQNQIIYCRAPVKLACHPNLPPHPSEDLEYSDPGNSAPFPFPPERMAALLGCAEHSFSACVGISTVLTPLSQIGSSSGLDDLCQADRKMGLASCSKTHAES